MFGPLLYLAAFIALTSAVPETLTNDQELDISTCPIQYYQKTYSQLFVNFTNDNFVICFEKFLKNGPSEDCMFLPTPSDGKANYDVLSQDSTYKSTIQENVATITDNMICAIIFSLVVNGENVNLTVSSFGSQTAVALYSDTSGQASCEVWVNGGKVETISANPKQPTVFTDVSGCRISGGGIKPNTEINSPTTCTNNSCSINRNLITTSCGNHERCNGNNVCVPINICTVTGPTIIDIHGNSHSVGDRCVYSLCSLPDFTMLAEFKERNRLDMSYLDSLTLKVLETEIHLGQGRKVLVNNVSQTLDSTVQTFAAVELFADQTGIHANLTLAGFRVLIHFDGIMAQITIEGSVGSSLGGLCEDSSSFSTAKDSTKSLPGCETQYTESGTNTINCTRMTELCNILKEEPFSSCNTVVDPAPYIKVCSDTLCRHSVVDELKCQFLQAYARACSLKDNALEDWQSNAQCSSPYILCQDKDCKGHEYCRIKQSGQSACLCRAIFTSSYKNKLAHETICTQNYVSVSLPKCLLVEKNINYSQLHLNDVNCKGVSDHNGMLTFSFNSSHSCGAVITVNETQIIRKNTIKSPDTSSGLIYREDPFSMNVTCISAANEWDSLILKVKSSSVIQEIKSEKCNYTINMKTCLDATCTKPLEPDTKIDLNTAVFIVVEAIGLDPKHHAIVIDSCYASNETSSSTDMKHNLILNSCPNPEDQTVIMLHNGNNVSCSFCFSSFQFRDSKTDIYLTCKIGVCLNDLSNCTPICLGAARRRRSVNSKYEPEALAIVSMALIH